MLLDALSQSLHLSKASMSHIAQAALSDRPMSLPEECQGASASPLTHRKSPSCQIIFAEVAVGQLGLGGKLGYSTPMGDSVVASGIEEGSITLSAHAPSELSIRTSCPMRVRGVLSGTAGSRIHLPATFVINDHPIGQVQGPFDSTGTVILPAGDHCLRVASRSPEERQTVWILCPVEEESVSTDEARLSIVTIACYPGDEAAEVLWPLAESVQWFGSFLSVMGVGTAYCNHASAKLRRLLEYVRALDTDYILFTDGKDSVLVGDTHEILRKFREFGTDFVISMERDCWPVFHDGWRNACPQMEDRWNFPNAGGWIGTKSGVIRVLTAACELQRSLVTGEYRGTGAKWDELLAPLHQDDQALLQLLYLEGVIVGDVRCRIFTNVALADRRLAGNDQYSFRNGRLRLNSTGEWPAVVHFSGPAFPECRDRWPAYFRACRGERSEATDSRRSVFA